MKNNPETLLRFTSKTDTKNIDISRPLAQGLVKAALSAIVEKWEFISHTVRWDYDAGPVGWDGAKAISNDPNSPYPGGQQEIEIIISPFSRPEVGTKYSLPHPSIWVNYVFAGRTPLGDDALLSTTLHEGEITFTHLDIEGRRIAGNFRGKSYWDDRWEGSQGEYLISNAEFDIAD